MRIKLGDLVVASMRSPGTVRKGTRRTKGLPLGYVMEHEKRGSVRVAGESQPTKYGFAYTITKYRVDRS